MLQYPSNQPQTMQFQVRYQRPYSNDWYSQWFPTLAEAERQVAFYISCGAPAHLVR